MRILPTNFKVETNCFVVVVKQIMIGERKVSHFEQMIKGHYVMVNPMTTIVIVMNLIGVFVRITKTKVNRTVIDNLRNVIVNVYLSLSHVNFSTFFD